MILALDTYSVINKSIISDIDRKIIIDLYQPIIGSDAVTLYFCLLNNLERSVVISDKHNHYYLQKVMHINLEDLNIAKDKLEAIGLLKTYLKKDRINDYIYILYSPLSAYDFFLHPILNIVLYNNIGKEEYSKVVEYYKVPKINMKEYEDVTHSFDEIFSSYPTDEFIVNSDIATKEKNSIKIFHKFDFTLLLGGINDSLVNKNCFNKEIKELILNLSYIYNIDELTMQQIIKTSLNEKGLINQEELRKNCRNYYRFDNNDSLPTVVYKKSTDINKESPIISKRDKLIHTFETTTPYQFIKSKYKDGKVTTRDLKIIEELLVDQKLSPGVVNVLIDYVLRVNNQKLNKNYIDAIVGQWKRLGINSAIDAMELCEKEYKSPKKKNVVRSNYKEKTIPEWFDKDIAKKEITKEEEQELEDLLSEF